MRVYIIGGGPGDPKLLTLRGAELIASCGVVMYTGSLVPREVIGRARADAVVIDSSKLTLDEIVEHIVAARDAGEDVARVHTGDPAVFGSTAEQMRRLEALGIEPGDEIITTPMTFISTPNAALFHGATPVFADVHPKTGLLDPAAGGDRLRLHDGH